MPSTAKYLFIVSMDVEPEHEDLFNEVYDTEHVPNICKVPGIITAYRLKLEEAPLSAGSRASVRAPRRCKSTWRFLSWSVPIFWEAMPGPRRLNSADGRRKFDRTRSIGGTRYGK